jgi:hypothetical protein
MEQICKIETKPLAGTITDISAKSRRNAEGRLTGGLLVVPIG